VIGIGLDHAHPETFATKRSVREETILGTQSGWVCQPYADVVALEAVGRFERTVC